MVVSKFSRKGREHLFDFLYGLIERGAIERESFVSSFAVIDSFELDEVLEDVAKIARAELKAILETIEEVDD